jgi:hypothetical protein
MAISCIIEKIEQGLIPENEGKKLLRRAEAMKGMYDGPDSEKLAVRGLLKSYEREVAAAALEARLALEAASSFKREIGKLTPENIKTRMTQFIGQKFEVYRKDAAEQPLGFLREAMAKIDLDVDDISTVDQLALVRDMFGDKTARNSSISTLGRALKDVIKFQRKQMRGAGLPVADLPEGALPVSLRPGKLMTTSEDDFVAAFQNADAAFLVENVPFMSEVGNFDEFIRLYYNVLKGGASSYVQEFVEKGYSFTPAEMVAFVRGNTIARSIDQYQALNKAFSNGKGDIIEDVVSVVRENASAVGRKHAFGNPRLYK